PRRCLGYDFHAARCRLAGTGPLRAPIEQNCRLMPTPESSPTGRFLLPPSCLARDAGFAILSDAVRWRVEIAALGVVRIWSKGRTHKAHSFNRVKHARCIT